MIKNKDIETVLSAIKSDFTDASEKDIIFLMLCDTISEKDTAYKMAYGKKCTKIKEFISSHKILKIKELLKPFGIGVDMSSTISRTENREDLIKLLGKIKEASDNGELETKDAIKLETDIRVKLNDKFNIEAEKEQRRIIIVPQKHDLICPHTNRECSNMPSKEACMKYYNLTEEKHG
jgi:hypothetical protein